MLFRSSATEGSITRRKIEDEPRFLADLGFTEASHNKEVAELGRDFFTSIPLENNKNEIVVMKIGRAHV